MRDYNGSVIAGNGAGGGDRECPECGGAVSGTHRFCPECGTFVPRVESVLQVGQDAGRATEAARDDDVRLYDDESDGYDGYDGAVSAPREFDREHRSNTDMAGRSFREFNAAISARRGKKDRKGGIFLVVLFLLFVGSLGGGVYWFLQQAGRIPWEDGNFAPAPEAVRTVEEAGGDPAVPLATPGGVVVDGAPPSTSQPLPFIAGDSLEIPRPTKGVVIGSGVNLRGSHSVSSPVVGKVTTGNEVDVLESWTSDEGAEVVALVDVELAADDGRTVRLTRGRGVSLLSGPDALGNLRVALPDDKGRTPYTAAANTMSPPRSWPWYRIRPRGGKEGWIFGKFVTVLSPEEHSLPAATLERALNSFGSTREALVSILGEPLKASKKSVKVSGEPAEEESLGFDGLTVVLLNRGGITEVKSLTFFTSRHYLEGGLSVGLERRAVLSILGFPNAFEKGSEVYRSDSRTGIRVRYENYSVKTLHVGTLN